MELKKKALAWSKQFSWKKAARQVLEAYHEVLDKEPHVIH
jgi:glycogen synthase